MASLRRRIAEQRWIAAAILAAALFLRVLVPVGFMPDFTTGQLRMSICPGAESMQMATGTSEMTHVMPMDMSDPTHGKTKMDHHGKSEMVCPFSGLSAPSLAGVDPIQLALAIAFIVAIALVCRPHFRIGRMLRLRPPLRAPPPLI